MALRLLAASIVFLTFEGLALAQVPAVIVQPAAAGTAETDRHTLSPASVSPGGGVLQPIVVTGYIIPRLGENTQPVFNIDREFWERRGQQNVAQILETLPFATGNFNQNNGPGVNNSPGNDAVNHRNVGINATLVLVDGLRFPSSPLPVGFTRSFVDLNSIPIAAIDRIENLKSPAAVQTSN